MGQLVTSICLKFESVEKSFKRHKAIDGLSFEVQRGECFALLGPNGAGKTTTLDLIEGLIRPDKGRVEVFGQLAPAPAGQVGVLFQQSALPDYLKVGEVLKLFAALYSRTIPIDQLIAALDLESILDQRVRLLSGGQRQRVLLALALLHDPQLVLLDEPTTGLDPNARRELWSLLKELLARGKTLLLSSHNMQEVEDLCDRLMLLHRGRVVAEGKPDHLLQQHFSKQMISFASKQAMSDMPPELMLEADGSRFRMLAEDSHSALQRLLNADIEFSDLQLHRANLDDLFSLLTGQHLVADA